MRHLAILLALIGALAAAGCSAEEIGEDQAARLLEEQLPQAENVGCASTGGISFSCEATVDGERIDYSVKVDESGIDIAR